MKEAYQQIIEVLKHQRTKDTLTAIAILLVAVLAAKVVRRAVSRKKQFTSQHVLLGQVGGIVIVAVGVLFSLRILGVDLNVLLGAAGILTVALGFASQTSASNIISGLFLMAEKPFKAGDLITVGDTTGYVLSVDLLSVRLRTFDNLMVRIPNETVLKAKVVNITHFPIRRIDLKIGVAYKENLEKVKSLLIDLVDRNPLCFDEPAPFFYFLGYGDSALEFQFSVWTTQSEFWSVRTELHLEIKKLFDEHNIEIPFPHRSLYVGSATEPFPVKMVSSDDDRRL